MLAASLLFIFRQCDAAGQVILLVLFLASVLSWTVMVTKFRLLAFLRRQNTRFLRDYRAETNVLRPYRLRREYLGGTIFSVYQAGCRELLYQLPELEKQAALDEEGDQPLPRHALTPPQLRSIIAAMERAVGEAALRLESRMIVLATAVSGAPFLGLLGTVWGVMTTFSDIALAGNPNLSTMAPGVSAALLTTVTGLLVAIPAMFGYNYLVASIRALVVEMDNFAPELAARFERRFLHHHAHPHAPLSDPFEG